MNITNKNSFLCVIGLSVCRQDSYLKCVIYKTSVLNGGIVPLAVTPKLLVYRSWQKSVRILRFANCILGLYLQYLANTSISLTLMS